MNRCRSCNKRRPAEDLLRVDCTFHRKPEICGSPFYVCRPTIEAQDKAWMTCFRRAVGSSLVHAVSQAAA